jgi:hypothetical protein
MGQTAEACQKHKLSFTLSPEQLKELEPLIRTSGEVALTGGGITGQMMYISYVACNGTADVGRQLRAAGSGLDPACVHDAQVPRATFRTHTVPRR